MRTLKILNPYSKHIHDSQVDYENVRRLLLQIVSAKDHTTLNEHFGMLKNIVQKHEDNVVIKNSGLKGVQ